MSRLGWLVLVLISACASEFVPPPIEPLPDKEAVEKKVSIQVNQIAVPFQTMEAYGFSGPEVYSARPNLEREYSTPDKCPKDPDIKLSSLIKLAANLHGEECSVNTHLEEDEHGVHRWLIAECEDSLEMIVVIFQDQHPRDYVETATIGYTDPIAEKRCVWTSGLRVGSRPIVADDDALRPPSR